MIKIKWFLFVFIVIFMFQGYAKENMTENLIPEPDMIAHKILDRTINELTKRYNIHPCGIGMNGKFEYLEISFQVFKPLSKEQARIMLFDCIAELLENINTDEKIRPYLKKYPFDFENVGIVFYISNNNGEDLYHPEICVARCSKSGVSFKTSDPQNDFKYKETYEETHEEALSIVNKQKQVAPKTSNE